MATQLLSIYHPTNTNRENIAEDTVKILCIINDLLFVVMSRYTACKAAQINDSTEKVSKP